MKNPVAGLLDVEGRLLFKNADRYEKMENLLVKINAKKVEGNFDETPA
jgi:hypothetical protein